MIKQYLGDGIPPVEELVKQTSLMFLNQHYSLSGPYPRSPSVVELMGVHIKEPKEIDKVRCIINYWIWFLLIKKHNQENHRATPSYKRNYIIQCKRVQLKFAYLLDR